MSEPPAVLRYGDREIELPVVIGSEGEPAIDISKLRSQTGLVTLDNAFVNTASCESAITFIDGEAGILRYRGIAIEDLVNVPNPSFLETSWLLIYGGSPPNSMVVPEQGVAAAGMLAISAEVKNAVVESDVVERAKKRIARTGECISSVALNGRVTRVGKGKFTCDCGEFPSWAA